MSANASNSAEPAKAAVLAPEWFHGGAHAWRKAKSAFEAGRAMDQNGAQHAAVGVALCALSAIACVAAQSLGVGPAAGFALGSAGCLAVAVGQRLRARAYPLMSQGVVDAIARSANPGLRPEASEDERSRATHAARQSRMGSAPGSFEELASGVAEGRSARREIIAPLSWLGGIAFKRLGKPQAGAVSEA